MRASVFWLDRDFKYSYTWTASLPPAWAWAINGFASVVGAVLATLLAIHLGFAAVIILAVLIYGLAAFALPRFA